MENIQILLPLNNVLTVKSAAILRTVSKTCKNFIKVKNYSFYKIFKQLNLSVDCVIKMLYKTDNDFLESEQDEPFYLFIGLHKFGDKLKELVLNSKYYWCIMEFAEELISNEDYRYINDKINRFFLLQLAYDHCIMYTEYGPLIGLLIELCVTYEF